MPSSHSSPVPRPAVTWAAGSLPPPAPPPPQHHQPPSLSAHAALPGSRAPLCPGHHGQGARPPGAQWLLPMTTPPPEEKARSPRAQAASGGAFRRPGPQRGRGGASPGWEGPAGKERKSGSWVAADSRTDKQQEGGDGLSLTTTIPNDPAHGSASSPGGLGPGTGFSSRARCARAGQGDPGGLPCEPGQAHKGLCGAWHGALPPGRG